LTYGTNESESTSSDVKKSEKLMTKRYQQHSKFFNDAFSKVMIELPKIKEDTILFPDYVVGMENTHPARISWVRC